MPSPIEAVTLDFFNTLVFHRDGRGRGGALIEYLEREGFRPAPWRHEILYEVFAGHGEAYSPAASSKQKRKYYVGLSARVFHCLEIRAPRRVVAEHAAALWGLLGPACFDLFPDVRAAVRALHARAIPLTVVSNWQSGLRHFCVEFGLSDNFEQVLASADVGIEKPDRRIFLEACGRLGVPPERTLHVGDSYTEDYVGGEGPGLRVALLDRGGNADPRARRMVRTLAELGALVDEPEACG